MSRRSTIHFALAALLLMGALAAGCGGGGPREPSAEEQAAIETRMDDYAKALSDDGKAVCANFVPELVDDLGGQDACAKAYDALLKGDASDSFAHVYDDLEIDHIEIAADGSIARLYAVDIEQPIRFEPVGDDWYVVPPPVLPGETPPPAPST